MCYFTVNLTAIGHLCVILNICFVVSCRTSILSEVSTRSSSKLPSGKNILIFGKYYLFYMCESLCFCAVWSVFLTVNPEGSGGPANCTELT